MSKQSHAPRSVIVPVGSHTIRLSQAAQTQLAALVPNEDIMCLASQVWVEKNRDKLCIHLSKVRFRGAG